MGRCLCEVPKAHAADGCKGPPKVDAAGKSELQETAEAALLSKRHQQKCDGPKTRVTNELKVVLRRRTEADPAAPGHGGNQNRERPEARHETADKARSGGGAGEVVVQKPPALDAGQDGHGCGESHYPCALTHDRRCGGLIGKLDVKHACKKGRDEGSEDVRKEIEKCGEEQNGPARAQALRSQKHP